MISLFNFLKKKELNLKEIKKELGKEFILYKRLKRKLNQENIKLNKKNISIFNPGSEADIISPLLVLDACVDLKEEHNILLCFVDLKDLDIVIRERIKKTILNSSPKLNIKENYTDIRFKLKNSDITIRYIKKDALRFIDKMDCFDIYFERAFDIIRSDDKEYPQKILKKTNHIIFSDKPIANDTIIRKSGFKKIKLSKNLKNIGFYKEFSVLTRITT